ncbi:hypothetical protein [Microvirga arabica]|uniref:hypothetical protein n=1 Tax=Microvirga arabica TaxID=1128671 RepID=UPI00193A6C86|nr:hypothetical protein [Microvirga arabica]MBM1172325.1 hypothetical protein [Microvirga arabica]
MDIILFPAKAASSAAKMAPIASVLFNRLDWSFHYRKRGVEEQRCFAKGSSSGGNRGAGIMELEPSFGMHDVLPPPFAQFTAGERPIWLSGWHPEAPGLVVEGRASSKIILGHDASFAVNLTINVAFTLTIRHKPLTRAYFPSRVIMLRP